MLAQPEHELLLSCDIHDRMNYEAFNYVFNFVAIYECLAAISLLNVEGKYWEETGTYRFLPRRSNASVRLSLTKLTWYQGTRRT